MLFTGNEVRWALQRTHTNTHIYIDMCHSLNKAGGYIGGINTVDADEGLSVLAVIHWKSEDTEN